MSSPSSPSKGAAQPTPQPSTTTTTTTTAAKEKEKVEKKKAPTKAQGERWTSSITALLQDCEGVDAFRRYLEGLENERDDQGEYTKYIDFYLECEEYKDEFKKLEDRAKDIFETYLSVTADKEVSVDGKGVGIGDKLDEEGLEGVTLFDEPQKKAKQKLTDLWYPGFCEDLKSKLKL